MREIPSSEPQKDEGIWDIKEAEERVIMPNQWGAVSAKVFKALAVTHSSLPAGCYSVTLDKNANSVLFIGKYIKSDKIMRFSGDMVDNLLDEIDDFWKREKLFVDNGFLHRRGYLLYGSQGTGKSSAV